MITQEKIKELAKQAGFERLGVYAQFGDDWVSFTEDLETFAKLIVEKEREACAKIAENRILHDENKDIKKGYLFAQQSIAQDIRTRGQE